MTKGQGERPHLWRAIKVAGSLSGAFVVYYHVSDFVHKWRTGSLEWTDLVITGGLMVLAAAMLAIIFWWRTGQSVPLLPNPPVHALFVEILLESPHYDGTYFGLGACLTGRVHAAICVRDALRYLRTWTDNLSAEVRKATLRDRPSVYRLRAAVGEGLAMLAFFNQLSLWRVIGTLPELASFVEFLTLFEAKFQASLDVLHRLINQYERPKAKPPTVDEVQRCITGLSESIEGLTEVLRGFPETLDQCISSEKQRCDDYSKLRVLKRKITY